MLLHCDWSPLIEKNWPLQWPLSRRWSSWSVLRSDISNHHWTLLLLCDQSSCAHLKSICSDSSPLLSLLQDFSSKVEGMSSGFALLRLASAVSVLSNYATFSLTRQSKVGLILDLSNQFWTLFLSSGNPVILRIVYGKWLENGCHGGL